MLTTLGIVISFRIWTIRSEAPNDDLVSLGRTFNDYIGMGMRSLTNFNDCLKESLSPVEMQIKLSDKYPTILGVCYDF
jgi:hypothetical protein